VWRAALRYLDFVEMRPLKLAVLALDLGIPEASLSRVVGRLVERGFLRRDGRETGGGAWRYRVPLARYLGGKSLTTEPDAPSPNKRHLLPECP
jgi:DNA-binding IclR family transcriptional regulator